MKPKAPYNFIPLPNCVFYPDWGNKISFSTPFEDGINGVIDVTLTAKSPIFVRNGLSKNEITDNDRYSIQPNEYNKFNHITDAKGNYHYFIPGSSIKGLLRSTIEIISNGKFEQVEDRSFGKRDLNNNSYRNNMKTVNCGWLVKEEDEYVIYDHGNPMKIEVNKIDNAFNGLNLFQFITTGSFDNDRNKRNKTALAKYYKLANLLNIKVDKLIDSIEETSNNAEFGGTLVFTGQPGRHKPHETNKFKKGKHHEFLIPNRDNPIRRPVGEQLIQSFTTIHVNSEDWKKLWYNRFNEGRKIPVFFIIQNNTVHSIGLSRMYKYPYQKSVYDAIPQNFIEKNKHDLAECIFGYSKKDNGNLIALKGRVQVGHFFANEDSVSCKNVHKLILGTPHPSYYPLYVLNGTDWDNATRVNGRKFYPIRKGNSILPPPNEQSLVQNGCLIRSAIAMCPLKSGTVFSGKIRFFNLKPFELGALISALTLFNNKKLFHSIGMGKPLGYGKTSIEVNKVLIRKNSDPEKELEGIDVDECIKYFTSGINGETEENSYNYSKWRDSQVKTELYAMSSENDNVDTYMVMTTDRKTNEFILCKNSDSEGLPRFSDLKNKKINH